MTGATGYKVFRGTSAGAEDLTTPVGSPTNSYVDTTAANGTQYWYVVRAWNAGGDSGNSNEVSATPAAPPPPPPPPGAPTNLAATPGDAQISLTWTAVSGATSYKVFRGPAAGAEDLTTPVGSPTSNSYVDRPAVNGTTYYYVVRASNAGGDSGNSNEVSATPTAASRSFVFSDGFESGSMINWTTKSTNWTFPSSPVHSGTKSAQVTTTVGATFAKRFPGCIVTATSCATTYPDAYFRTWVYLSSHTTQVNLMRLRFGSDSSLGYLSVTAQGKLQLRSDIGATTWTSTTDFPTSLGWHSLELHVTVNGATGGSSEVWLDDAKVADLSLTGVNWGVVGTNNISKVQIGEVALGNPPGNWTVAFDDVAFDTAKIGLAPVP